MGEGKTEGGDVGLTGGYGEGELQFTLAEKRCKNFGTCTADFDMNPHDGYSEVNKKIFALFSAGRDEILSAVDSTRSDKCEPITETMNEITGLMLVPFIQGVQRYLYKTAQGTASAKEAGELFAFASAALPFIDAVDPSAAEKLYNRAWKQDFSTESDFKTIKYAIEGTYPKLGVGAGQGKVTCSAVGELVDNGVTLSQACIDAAAPPVNIAGYEPASDVIQHARIDLDVNAIIDDLPGKNSGDINDCANNQCKYDADNMAAPVTAGKASDVWTNGKYSRKSSSLRTIKGFAEGAADKSSCSGGKTPCIKVATDVDYKDNGFISVMNAYWKKKGLNEFTWGEQIIDAAFKGTPLVDVDFSKVGWDFRKETIGKGIVYLNVFPYVIWEMQDAINDCKAGKLSANADSVHAWDEAVAFYTGSLEGTTQGGDVGLTGGYGEGELQFTVAEKRCKNFGTCTADFDSTINNGYSQVNHDIFQLFTRGRDQILSAANSGDAGACHALTETMNEISGLMLVPFIQGVQRYLYKTAQGTASAKEAGELFAFASAALPFIDAVDSTAADKLYNRAWKQDFTTESDFKT